MENKMELAAKVGAEMHDLRDDLRAARMYLESVAQALRAGRPEDVQGHIQMTHRALASALKRSESPAKLVRVEQVD